MTEILLSGIVAGVVAYRLWRLIALDTILYRLRPDPVHAFVACPNCLGFWCAGIISGLVTWWAFPEWPLAWGVASVVLPAIANHLGD